MHSTKELFIHSRVFLTKYNVSPFLAAGEACCVSVSQGEEAPVP